MTRPGWPVGDRMAYGGDYNPDQWAEDVWVEDIRLMKRAGVNFVTVGVFAWSRLQPTADSWDLGWLDRITAMLRDAGISIDLATGTASPPPWFATAHPEALPMAADGSRLGVGSRGHYCPSSDAYQQAAARLVERLASHYTGPTAPAMWHVNNEFGEKTEQCYCPVSAQRFREWLEIRYGTPAALNDAWGGDVWSQRYSSWAEVEPPMAAPGPLNPSQTLDYRRFSSDEHRRCFQLERDVLDRLSPGVPVTTNFMGPLTEIHRGFFKAIDYWKFATQVDLVADDAYPDPLDSQSHINSAMNFDLIRSLGAGAPWLLMEQAPGATSWQPVNIPKAPGAMRAGSYQAVARGADGVMFFQWRQARTGQEKFATGMLPPGGTSSRTWSDIVDLGQELSSLSEVVGSRVIAKVAFLLDWESWWALEQSDHPSVAMRLGDLTSGFYRPMYESNVAVDFRSPAADLTAYSLVVAPNLYSVSSATVANLSRYVSGGGTLVIGPFSGIVDEQDHLWPGPYPGGVRDLLGIRIDEFWPHPTDTWSVRLDGGERFHASTWAEWIDVTDATAVGTFDDGPLRGRPAITVRNQGRGSVFHVGVIPDDDGWQAVLDHVLAVADVRAGRTSAKGVELTERTNGHVSYLFAINHSTTDQVVRGVSGDVLVGDPNVEEGLRLGPKAVAIVRLGPPSADLTTNRP